MISLLALLSFVSEISWQKVLLMGMIYGAILFLMIKSTKRVLIASFIVLIGVIMGVNYWDSSPIRKYQKKYLSSNHLTANQSNLVKFIRKNTSSTSVFLSPHLFGFIRTEAERAIVIDFKAFPFKETVMLEWYRRIEDCYGLQENSFEKVYQNLDDARIQELQKKYNFNYAILYQETETKIPVIYSDSEYKIIDLTSYAQ